MNARQHQLTIDWHRQHLAIRQARLDRLLQLQTQGAISQEEVEESQLAVIDEEYALAMARAEEPSQ